MSSNTKPTASATSGEGPVEVPIPVAKLRLALGVAGDAVLIGGQALAFWVAHLDITVHQAEWPRTFISMDADFLGDREAVERFARVLKGKAIYPGRQITTLAGQVHVNSGDGRFFGVDVLRRVVGVKNAGIVSQAVEVELPIEGKPKFRVMDPVDLLASRLENLRKLKEKQNEVGVWQAKMAIRVCRRYIEELLGGDREKDAIKAITAIASIASHAMGRHAAREYGLDILSAVPADQIKNPKFQAEQWPRILKRMDELLGKD